MKLSRRGLLARISFRSARPSEVPPHGGAPPGTPADADRPQLRRGPQPAAGAGQGRPQASALEVVEAGWKQRQRGVLPATGVSGRQRKAASQDYHGSGQARSRHLDYVGSADRRATALNLQRSARATLGNGPLRSLARKKAYRRTSQKRPRPLFQIYQDCRAARLRALSAPQGRATREAPCSRWRPREEPPPGLSINPGVEEAASRPRRREAAASR